MVKGQTKAESLVESSVNIGIGYCVSLMVQILVFPLFDLKVTFGENVTICLIFTAASLIRMYCLRRFFNWRKRAGVQRQMDEIAESIKGKK